MIHKVIDRLEELIEIIPPKLTEINELNFSFKSSPEKWSKKEILGHLIDSATNNHQRFLRAQFENSPTIWYDQNNWVEKSNYQNIDKQHLIDFWTNYNKHLVHIIKSINVENLKNKCKTKDRSDLTIEFLICDYIEHLEHHLEQIIPQKKMKIQKAELTDNEILTQITKKSKAYWGFSEEVLTEWEHLLIVSKKYIEENQVYKLIVENEPIGYYSYFTTDEKSVKLDNLFLLPQYIGKGFGKVLMEHFLNEVRNIGINRITLDSEPNTEKFYNKFGFFKIGQFESSIKDRFLPIMELKLDEEKNVS
ncbi:GNAT family N-acetyltransferase [Flavobacterium sp. I3-2]|uniref:GNAT family N-acetyltransferase n=1 Tax=Flavobacterium sp. I3-2 TaxID=2748319 RepID=UPI0015B2D50C|nr:GNAT family N-acetyltransferase [Flavobacterium sp. I3-2]